MGLYDPFGTGGILGSAFSATINDLLSPFSAHRGPEIAAPISLALKQQAAQQEAAMHRMYRQAYDEAKAAQESHVDLVLQPDGSYGPPQPVMLLEDKT